MPRASTDRQSPLRAGQAISRDRSDRAVTTRGQTIEELLAHTVLLWQFPARASRALAALRPLPAAPAADMVVGIHAAECPVPYCLNPPQGHYAAKMRKEALAGLHELLGLSPWRGPARPRSRTLRATPARVHSPPPLALRRPAGGYSLKFSGPIKLGRCLLIFGPRAPALAAGSWASTRPGSSACSRRASQTRTRSAARRSGRF